MSIKITGLDRAKRELRELERKIERVSGTHEVPMSDVLTDDFMIRFTNFTSFDDMIEKSGFEVNSIEDFEAIPDEPWDQFVAENTQFASWSEMQEAAAAEYFERLLRD